MAKNIVVFSDGTGQRGGIKPDQALTNVYKLYRAARVSSDNEVNPSEQIAFYDPGLGTITERGLFKFSLYDKAKALLGLAFGTGITTNIIDCYEFILANYKSGDRIYLIGFSRGAYTVRSVAGVLRMCGVPTHDSNGGDLPASGPRLRKIAEEATKGVYEFEIGNRGWGYSKERLEPGNVFRQKYGCAANERDDKKHIYSNVSPYLIGVFDTVAALGVKGWRKCILLFAFAILVAAISAALGWIVAALATLSFVTCWVGTGIVLAIITYSLMAILRWRSSDYDQSLDFRVKCARHAMAIDERRDDFKKVGWGRIEDVDAHNAIQKPGEPDWFKQIWFAGDHSDIGGGYAESESRLSDITLSWMIEQLDEMPHPLLLNRKNLRVFPDPGGMQHDEVQASREKWYRPTWRECARSVPDGSILHESVLIRFRCEHVKNFRQWGTYRPENLRDNSIVAQFY